eukprot:scaffold14525_cov46-Phaeocystis_antarctica.AAC.3
MRVAVRMAVRVAAVTAEEVTAEARVVAARVVVTAEATVVVAKEGARVAEAMLGLGLGLGLGPGLGLRLGLGLGRRRVRGRVRVSDDPLDSVNTTTEGWGRSGRCSPCAPSQGVRSGLTLPLTTTLPLTLLGASPSPAARSGREIHNPNPYLSPNPNANPNANHRVAPSQGVRSGTVSAHPSAARRGSAGRSAPGTPW